MTFERAFALTCDAEGGYSNHPKDRGGITYKGVTQRTFSAWLAANNEDDRDVITMTDAEHKTLAYVGYWKRAHCEDCPERVGCFHFDASYNHGPALAVRLLQEALGVEIDGVYGPETNNALGLIDDLATLDAYFEARRMLYCRIVAHDPSQAVFLDGWNNRIRKLSDALK